MTAFPKEIFKAYDIRGIVGKTLTPEIVEAIGQAIGSEAIARRQSTIVIGRDGRLSGPALAEALARGIQKSGVDVIDVGQVATPMLYFATHQLETYSGVMVTGSHNPPDYNGLKMVLGGETLAGETIQGLRERLEKGELSNGGGGYRQHDIADAYIRRIVGDIKLARPMKVVIDCGNGVPGAFAPRLYRELGCQVAELFCEVDGNFPNHHPDPSQPKNLQDVIAALASSDAEIGLAFDGDGDRCGVVDNQGEEIFADKVGVMLARDISTSHKGAKFVADVKSTGLFATDPVLIENGASTTYWKTGHSYIKRFSHETGALVGFEKSGHFFFNPPLGRGYDDG
ncbi:MAG TPA: phosphomannomutase/phosphoglucomutase, partial [Betaproteobacteria bacterium]|nr:phosphomannomutase/phosphoglucomutase [Betaproteobacteria bacterium]